MAEEQEKVAQEEERVEQPEEGLAEQEAANKAAETAALRAEIIDAVREVLTEQVAAKDTKSEEEKPLFDVPDDENEAYPGQAADRMAWNEFVKRQSRVEKLLLQATKGAEEDVAAQEWKSAEESFLEEYPEFNKNPALMQKLYGLMKNVEKNKNLVYKAVRALMLQTTPRSKPAPGTERPKTSGAATVPAEVHHLPIEKATDEAIKDVLEQLQRGKE